MKYNLLWRRRTVVLLERTLITVKYCLLLVGKSTSTSVALAHSVPKHWPHGCLRVAWRQWWKWKTPRTSSLFVLYLVSARLQCLQHCFRRCCVAEGLSDKHKSSDGHATGVVPNSLAEPWACARWTLLATVEKSSTRKIVIMDSRPQVVKTNLETFLVVALVS